MKMKKLLAGLLSVAMVVTSVSFGGFGVNEVEAAVVMDTVTSVSEIDATVLAQNATANSWVEGHNNDGAASDAFTSGGKIWHSNWKTVTDTNKDGNASVTNPIWIQTGFGKEVKLNKITYVGRNLTSTDNMIKDFKVYVSTQETAPTEEVSDATKWTEVTLTSNTLPGTAGRKTIECNDVAARWVRIVVTSVYNGNAAKSHVAASEIKMYETVENQINLNDYKTFWRYERLKNTLGTQTTEDRWRFEHKLNNEWKENQHEVDNMFFSNDGNSSSVAEQNQGEWAKKESWDNKIWFTGFKGITQAYQSVAITWVAPRDGYYKFKQVGNAATATLSNGKMEVKLVKAGDTTTDGTNVYTQTTGNAFEAPIVKLAANDKLRFMTVYGNDVLHYHGNLNNADTLTWEVVPCTVREYATQYMEEVTLNAEKPQALQDDVTEVKAALKALIDDSKTEDATIEQGIKDLEDAVARMNNYKAMTSVVFDKTTTQTLNINDLLTLNVTTDPADYPEVEWTVTPVTGTNVVEQGLTDKNQFTAKAPGTVTIKATSVYDNTKSAEVTVIVKADTSALEAKITEAKALLDAGNYTQASLDELSTAIKEAECVRDDATSTTTAIADAVKTLDEVINSLVRTYTVKAQYVGGTVIDTVKTGEIGDLVTFTADEVRDGKQFVRWTCNGKQFSTSRVVTIAITGDATYVAEYEAATEVTPEAQMINVVKTKNANGSMNARFIGQLVLPKGAVIEETGMIFRGKNTNNFADLVSNSETITPAAKARKYNTGVVNNENQFMMTFNNIPATKSVSAVVFAKVNVNGVVTTVYSDITTVTNN